MAQANVKLTVDASQATRALQGVQSQTNKLQNSFDRVRTAIATIGLGVLTKNTVSAANNFEKLNQRLRILTTENGTYSESVKLAEQAQEKFGLSTIEALEAVTNLQARLGVLGTSMEDISTIFNGFNTVAILSGASVQETNSAMRQLTQALGSGALRGDEFNSIAENMSAILAPIAEILETNVGALRDMAADGKITAAVVIKAFELIEKEGAGSLKELLKNDPTMVFKILSNQTEKLSIALGTLLAPAILDATRFLTSLTKAVTAFIESPIGQGAVIFTALAGAVKLTTVAISGLITAQTVLLAKFKASAIGAIVYNNVITATTVQTKLAAAATGALAIAMNALPLIAIASAIGLVTTAIVLQNRERKRQSDLINEGMIEEIKAEILRLEIAKKKREEQRRGTGLEGRVIERMEEQIRKLEDRLGILQDEKVEQEKQEERLERIKNLYDDIANSIETGLVDAIEGAINGTKTLGEVATAVFRQIQRSLIQYGVSTFLANMPGGIGSFFSKRADGGPVSKGGSYIVGERGPELFTPSTSGMITPNEALGGSTTSVVVNVDASGTSVEGNEASGQELGRLIGAVVQSELIKEKRPGGLLA